MPDYESLLREMVDGWRAREALEEHIGALKPMSDSLGTECAQCNKFVVALLTNPHPKVDEYAKILTLRCGRVQEWSRLIRRAHEIADIIPVHCEEDE